MIGPELAISLSRSENYHESPLQILRDRYPEIELIRAAQEAVADFLSDCTLVDCDTRESIPGELSIPWGLDGEHWTGVAQLQRGNRIASNLLNINSITQGPGGAS